MLAVPHRARLTLRDEESGLPTAQPELKVVARAMLQPAPLGPELPPTDATDVPVDPESSTADLDASGLDRVFWARGRGRAWTRILVPPTSAEVSMTVDLAPGGDLDVDLSEVSPEYSMLRVTVSGRGGHSTVRRAVDCPTPLRGLPAGTVLLSAVSDSSGVPDARRSALVSVVPSRRVSVRIREDRAEGPSGAHSVLLGIRVPRETPSAVRTGALRVLGLTERGVPIWRPLEAREDGDAGGLRAKADLPPGRYAVECLGHLAEPVLQIDERTAAATVEFRKRHDVTIAVRSRRSGSPVQASVWVLGLGPMVSIGIPATEVPADSMLDIGTTCETSTDSRGQAVIGLPTGSYRASVAASDGSAATCKFVVQEDRPARVDIEMDDAMAVEIELGKGLRARGSSWVSRLYALDRGGTGWEPRVRHQAEPKHVHGNLAPGNYYLEARGSDWEWGGQVSLIDGVRGRVLLMESLTWIPAR